MPADLGTKEGWCKAWGLTGPEADKAWAEKCAFVPTRLTPLIIGDIQPYQAMGTDVATGSAPMITTRSQHREYIKRNNYVEIGTEKLEPRKETPVNTREIGHQIKQIIDQKGIKL